jgi:hypothetical protein
MARVIASGAQQRVRRDEMLPHPEIRRELTRQRVVELRGAAAQPLRLRTTPRLGTQPSDFYARIGAAVAALRRRPKPAYPAT